ncbi:MAG TPA: hypothetical protein EYO33_01685, partial [Phycisphaerales bacterium]|nr:hypothetical protein [Phycisphaerales bacterium]
MQKDQIVSSWEMKLQHPAASPQTWTFSSDGLILQNEMQFGQWQHLGDGFFRIHLEKMRLCGLPVEYTARLEADFLTLYHGGEEMFAGQRLVALRQADPPEPSEETAVHHGIFGGISVSSVFGPEDEPTKQEAPPLPDIHQPWIGVWAPTRDIYLQRNYSRGGRSSELRLPNSSDSFMVLTADGVYQVGRTGRRGTWRRVPDGRMLLDQGEPRLERYYVIRQTPEGSERIGPYKEDGSRFKEGLEYTFYETIR